MTDSDEKVDIGKLLRLLAAVKGWVENECGQEPRAMTPIERELENAFRDIERDAERPRRCQ